MCIRDSPRIAPDLALTFRWAPNHGHGDNGDGVARRVCPYSCLLYTSDAADERSSVDLGGRRIIKKKKNIEQTSMDDPPQQCNKWADHEISQ